MRALYHVSITIDRRKIKRQINKIQKKDSKLSKKRKDISNHYVFFEFTTNLYNIFCIFIKRSNSKIHYQTKAYRNNYLRLICNIIYNQRFLTYSRKYKVSQSKNKIITLE